MLLPVLDEFCTRLEEMIGLMASCIVFDLLRDT